MELLNFCTDQRCDKFSCCTEHGHIHFFCSSRQYSRGYCNVLQNKFSFLKLFLLKIIQLHNLKLEPIEKFFTESFLRKCQFYWDTVLLWNSLNSLVHSTARFIDSGLFWESEWLHRDLAQTVTMHFVFILVPQSSNSLHHKVFFLLNLVSDRSSSISWVAEVLGHYGTTQCKKCQRYMLM